MSSLAAASRDGDVLYSCLHGHRWYPACESALLAGDRGLEKTLLGGQIGLVCGGRPGMVALNGSWGHRGHQVRSSSLSARDLTDLCEDLRPWWRLG